MNEQHDPDPTLSAQEAMRVIDEQTAATAQDISYNDRAVYLVWGVVYLIGYLPLALSVGPSAVVVLPNGLLVPFLLLCVAAGFVYSMVSVARMSRGLRGTSQIRGMLYGWSWTLSLLAAFGVSFRVDASGVADPEAGLLVNGAFVLVVGALFMAGGAVWEDLTQFVIGAAVLAMLTVALVVGLPAYYWIMSLGVGGLLLLAAAFHRPVERRLRAWFAARHG